MASEADFVCFIRGLHCLALPTDVRRFLETKCGEVTSLLVPRWPDTGKGKGIALAKFGDAQARMNCLMLDGTTFRGRRLQITLHSAYQAVGAAPVQVARPPPSQHHNAPDYGMEVYVQGLSYKATAEDVKAFFDQCGEVERVTLPRYLDSGKPYGFCFVKFATPNGLMRACELDGSLHFGRRLTIRRNRGKGGNSHARKKPVKKPEPCKTIFVGNLPFVSTDDELHNLFRDCGRVVQVRVVRQPFTNKSRGFGYVEFADQESADEACKKQDLYLQGRHLRVDYAEARDPPPLNRHHGQHRGPHPAPGPRPHRAVSPGLPSPFPHQPVATTPTASMATPGVHLSPAGQMPAFRPPTLQPSPRGATTSSSGLSPNAPSFTPSNSPPSHPAGGRGVPANLGLHMNVHVNVPQVQLPFSNPFMAAYNLVAPLQSMPVAGAPTAAVLPIMGAPPQHVAEGMQAAGSVSSMAGTHVQPVWAPAAIAGVAPFVAPLAPMQPSVSGQPLPMVREEDSEEQDAGSDQALDAEESKCSGDERAAHPLLQQQQPQHEPQAQHMAQLVRAVGSLELHDE